jgi:hypothetical protein
MFESGMIVSIAHFLDLDEKPPHDNQSWPWRGAIQPFCIAYISHHSFSGSRSLSFACFFLARFAAVVKMGKAIYYKSRLKGFPSI